MPFLRREHCHSRTSKRRPAPPGGGRSGSSGGARRSAPVNAIASSAAAKIEMHLRVPTNKSSESLIAKPLPPLDAAAKDTDKKVRTKTIRHTDCIEVGHDKFDEVMTNFCPRSVSLTSSALTRSPIRFWTSAPRS